MGPRAPRLKASSCAGCWVGVIRVIRVGVATYVVAGLEAVLSKVDRQELQLQAPLRRSHGHRHVGHGASSALGDGHNLAAAIAMSWI